MDDICGKVNLLVLRGTGFENADHGASLAVRVTSNGNESETLEIKNCGPKGGDWKAAFNFNIQADDKLFRLSVIDKDDHDEEIAHANFPLELIDDGASHPHLLKLEPNGELQLETRFVKAPIGQTPDFLVLRVGKAENVKKIGHGDNDYYVRAFFPEGDIEGTEGKSPVDKNCQWNWTHKMDYHNESEICLEVWDHDHIGHDDRIAETILDLWEPSLRVDNRKTGLVKFVTVKPPREPFCSLFIDYMFDFNKPLATLKSQETSMGTMPPLTPTEVPPVVAAAAIIEADPVLEKSSISSSSISSSDQIQNNNANNGIAAQATIVPEVAPLLNAEQLNDLQRAAAQADEDALKAREMAGVAARAHLQAPSSADAALQADSAAEVADDAEEAARRARNLCDTILADPRAASQGLVADLLDEARRASLDAQRATERAKDALGSAANEEAKKARVAAMGASQAAREIEEMAVTSPALAGPLREIGAEAEVAVARAETEARKARLEADEAARRGLPLNEVMEANQRAVKARERAEIYRRDAEECVKRARKHVRDDGRLRDKKEQAKVAKALEMQMRLEESREMERRAERDREMERRRGLIDDGGVLAAANEPNTYQYANAYEFHSPAARRSAMPGSMACCGPRGSMSSESGRLYSTLPKKEIRGGNMHPGDMYAPEELLYGSKAMDSGSGMQMLTRAPEPEFEEEELLAAAGLGRRPQCWCFGCGCMRCCGEC